MQATFLHLPALTGYTTEYTNPPPAAWLLQPLAAVPAEVSLAIFLVITAAAIAGSAVLLRRLLPTRLLAGDRRILLVVAVVSVPGAATLSLGQWDGLLLLAAAWAMVALRSDRPVLAGVLLGALFVKPQLIWLVPVVLIAAGSWRVLAGLSGVVAAWVAGSVALIGPQRLMDWPRNLLPHQSIEAHRTVGIPGVVASVSGDSGAAGFAAAAACLMVAGALAWRHRELLREHPDWALGLGLAGSILAAPHIWPHDLLLLAVPLVLWGGGGSLDRALTAGLLVDLAYLLDNGLPGPLDHMECLALIAVVAGMALDLRRGGAATDGGTAGAGARQPGGIRREIRAAEA